MSANTSHLAPKGLRVVDNQRRGTALPEPHTLATIFNISSI